MKKWSMIVIDTSKKSTINLRRILLMYKRRWSIIMDSALEIEAKIDFIEDTILTKSSVFSGYLSDYHLENFLTLFKYFSASLPVRNRQLVDDCYEYLLNKN